MKAEPRLVSMGPKAPFLINKAHYVWRLRQGDTSEPDRKSCAFNFILKRDRIKGHICECRRGNGLTTSAKKTVILPMANRGSLKLALLLSDLF